MRNSKMCAILQWRYCHEIWDCGYEPNQWEVEEPEPPPDQKAWGGHGKECDALSVQQLFEEARVPGTFSGTICCQHWRLPFYRCLLCFFWQEVSFRKRAFEAFKPYQMKQHVRIHTREKLYNCEICQCKFRLKYYIHSHKRRKHEKRFFCNV